MKPTALTTHKIKKARKGDEVLFKGEVYTIEKIGNKYVTIKPAVGKNKRISFEEIAAYTAGLADATKAYASEMRDHMQKVRNHTYISRYFMQPARAFHDR